MSEAEEYHKKIKDLDANGIISGYCPSCMHATRKLPQKGVEFCENPHCNWQRKYIGSVLKNDPKKENFRDKSQARKYADKIWDTHDLNDVTDFNISLSSALSMMEGYYQHKMREVLERVHESHIEEAGFHSMKKEVNSLDKRYGFIKGANWLLNHLKTKIKEG